MHRIHPNHHAGMYWMLQAMCNHTDSWCMTIPVNTDTKGEGAHLAAQIACAHAACTANHNCPTLLESCAG